MKVMVHLSNGSSPIVDLGEVPDNIDINGLGFFEFMVGICLKQGIDLQEILYIEEITSSVIK